MRKITILHILAFSAIFGISVGMAILTTVVSLERLPLGNYRVITSVGTGLVLVYTCAILVYRLFLAVMPLIESDLRSENRGD